MSSNETLVEALNELAETTLTSVDFVHDYIQFRFDGSRLNAYTPTIVERQGYMETPGDDGYTESLRSLIGQHVIRTRVDAEQVVIEFERGTIRVSLRAEDYRGPEAVELNIGGNRIWVA